MPDILINEATFERLVDAVLDTPAGEYDDPDNIAIALTSYFEDVIEKPYTPEEQLTEDGWSPWAVHQMQSTATRIVGAVLHALVDASEEQHIANHPCEVQPETRMAG